MCRLLSGSIAITHVGVLQVATHSEGQRDRYFADDDKFTLSEMVRECVSSIIALRAAARA